MQFPVRTLLHRDKDCEEKPKLHIRRLETALHNNALEFAATTLAWPNVPRPAPWNTCEIQSIAKSAFPRLCNSHHTWLSTIRSYPAKSRSCFPTRRYITPDCPCKLESLCHSTGWPARIAVPAGHASEHDTPGGRYAAVRADSSTRTAQRLRG
jgi:hypothetical protein